MHLVSAAHLSCTDETGQRVRRGHMRELQWAWLSASSQFMCSKKMLVSPKYVVPCSRACSMHPTWSLQPIHPLKKVLTEVFLHTCLISLTLLDDALNCILLLGHLLASAIAWCDAEASTLLHSRYLSKSTSSGFCIFSKHGIFFS